MAQPNGAQFDYVPAEQRRLSRRAINKLLGINAVSLAFSAFNETVIGHSALGFAQGSMELTDTIIVKGLATTESNDAQGKFKRASRQRQALYSLHIGTAAAGIIEGARLINVGAQPSVGNLVISGLVGVMNTHFLYHRRKHRKQEAHTTEPTIMTGFKDPIEVAQDKFHQFPDAEAIHRMNDNGTIAIAHTNIAEAGGGIVGSIAQFGLSQGAAIAAIGSSVAVVGIMGRQIHRELGIEMPV